jgi:hypothetical protein
MDIKVPSKYTTDFLQVLSVLVGPCSQALCIHLGIQHLKAKASFEPYHEK